MTPTKTYREPRVATPDEVRRYGWRGLLKRGLLPPTIAGGEPTALEQALAELDADMKQLTQAPAAPEAPEAAPAPEAPAATATLDQRSAELEAKATALAATEASLTATANQLKELQTTLLQHAGSRFVGSAAAEEVIKHVAAGGTTTPAGGVPIVDPRAVKAGPMVGVKELQESRSVSRFFAAIKATREGFATEVEREWLGASKALAEATGSAGGYLVPPDWMPDVLRLFRGVTVVRRARPGMMVRFTAQMNQVGLGGGATAYYTPENAAIPTSQESFTQQALLTPHNLTGLVPASDWLLNDTRRQDVPNQVGVDAEQTIRQDLAVVMALKEDLNFLTGNPGTETGSPTGLINLSGVVSNPINPGAALSPTLPQIRFIKNYVRRLNVPNARWVWFFHSDFLSYVEGLTDSLGRFLADAPNLLQVNDDDNSGTDTDPTASGTIVGAGAGMSGRLLNLPFYASNQIPVNLGTPGNQTWLLLVDMNQLVVGINQEMLIESSGEASYTPDGGTTWINAFQNNQTLFKATLRHDINHRYPGKGVVIQNGVTVA